MPIMYRIDHERRLVIARGYGAFTADDIFSYQRAVWSGRDVVGYDELVDMTLVTEIGRPSPQQIRNLATLASQMDLASAPSRLAIVAPGDAAYALALAFQSERQLQERSSKDVGAFRTLAEAWEFLDITDPPPLPPPPPAERHNL